MKFDLDSTWRLSEINVKYEVSPTYPRYHILPSCVADADLTRIAEFRSSRRFPSIVWRFGSFFPCHCARLLSGWSVYLDLTNSPPSSIYLGIGKTGV